MYKSATEMGCRSRPARAGEEEEEGIPLGRGAAAAAAVGGRCAPFANDVRTK